MKRKFSELIDKESLLLDMKRLTDFNNGCKLERKIDNIMWDFLYENSTDLNSSNIIWIRIFAEEIKEKL